MKKREFIARVAADLYLPEEAIELVLGGVADVVADALATSGRVAVGRLGTFRLAQQPLTSYVNDLTRMPFSRVSLPL